MHAGSNGVSSEDSGCSKRTGTVLIASFHILATAIGYGILSLPQATAQLGWINGPAAILVFAVVTLLHFCLLVVLLETSTLAREPLLTLMGGSTAFRTGGVTTIENTLRSFQALGDIAFAFNFSNILIEIQDTLSPPSEASMKVARLISLVVITLLYMLCGCFGYAAFGDSAPENFLHGFVKPYWLLEIANAAVVLHLICSYQAYCQPLFAFVEKTAAQKYLGSQFISRNFEIPMPGSEPYKLNLFGMVLRTMFVIITIVVAPRLTFLKEAVSFVGAWGFSLLTVYFPFQIYIAQKKITKWSGEWILLQILSCVCLVITIAAVVGSTAGIILDF
ncbi:Amino acid permease [Melia azedarach]|uniref:Amino acid permease n=1 Tax=Melia azedarach TaxID=155640 RepID=A0ACC1WPG5_MELAZ|nr:Amino acid permease [Melia azedarach]